MKTPFVVLIRIYQYFISPFLHFVTGSGSGCRFTPTCSQYTLESIQTEGAIKGSLLGFQRICSCHPWAEKENQHG